MALLEDYEMSPLCLCHKHSLAFQQIHLPPEPMTCTSVYHPHSSKTEVMQSPAGLFSNLWGEGA